MKIRLPQLAALAPVALIMTGCATSAQPPAQSIETATSQQLLRGLKIPPQGPVEITIAYCNAQNGIQSRKQVVNLGARAKFDHAKGVDYDLLVTAIPAQDGVLLTTAVAQWTEFSKPGAEKPWTRQASKAYQILTKDSEVSPPTTLPLPRGESCFTVAASTRPAAGAPEAGSATTNDHKQTVQN